MQQYIVIPELGCIVRKIAPDGRHAAYFGLGATSGPRRCVEELRSGDRPESSLIWDIFRQGPVGYHPVIFKEPA